MTAARPAAPGETYIIRGGAQGRERLRLLSRVMAPTSLALLRRAGVRPGMACLEAACGGGDLACDLAEMVGPEGFVLAVDIDETVLAIARTEAAARGIANIDFRRLDIVGEAAPGPFDFIHARFLLSHLREPAKAVARMREALRPGGAIALEDVDFRGHFSLPPCAALDAYVRLYTEAARRRGGDAEIGPRLPGLLREAGFAGVAMNVVQPAGDEGEVRLVTPITMENIAPAVVAAGLASRSEAERIIAELHAYGATPGAIGCLPRVIEAWGRA
jgi:SAM-dependent methyltransferase